MFHSYPFSPLSLSSCNLILKMMKLDTGQSYYVSIMVCKVGDTRHIREPDCRMSDFIYNLHNIWTSYWTLGGHLFCIVATEHEVASRNIPGLHDPWVMFQQSGYMQEQCQSDECMCTCNTCSLHHIVVASLQGINSCILQSFCIMVYDFISWVAWNTR